MDANNNQMRNQQYDPINPHSGHKGKVPSGYHRSRYQLNEGLGLGECEDAEQDFARPIGMYLILKSHEIL